MSSPTPEVERQGFATILHTRFNEALELLAIGGINSFDHLNHHGWVMAPCLQPETLVPSQSCNPSWIGQAAGTPKSRNPVCSNADRSRTGPASTASGSRRRSDRNNPNNRATHILSSPPPTSSSGNITVTNSSILGSFLNLSRMPGVPGRAALSKCAASVLLAALSGSHAVAEQLDDNQVLAVMAEELHRNLSVVASERAATHFISYEITRQSRRGVRSSFGKGEFRPDEVSTILDVDIRVGSPELDSSRARGMVSTSFSLSEVPVGDEKALRAVLWFQTARAHRAALEAFSDAKSRAEINVAKEDTSGDFSKSEEQRHVGTSEPLVVDLGRWLERLNALSGKFNSEPSLWNGSVRLALSETQRWYVNSEGTRLATPETRAMLTVAAGMRAEDGEFLSRSINFSAFDPSGLPDDAITAVAVGQVLQDVLALKDAPVMDPYSGPAILSGQASAVFFHEILGHRLEGHRLKLESDGQTFKSMVGESVLPPTFSVVFDPTLESFDGTDLMGHYLYDNEGVKATRVAAVEQGVLKRFLMSRSPIEGFPESNGHGRKQAGLRAVSRQSNLVVDVADPLSNDRLFDELAVLVEEQGTEYGLYLDVITGGFTQTGRYMPNAFNVNPVMVYKVFPDGSKQLVRGVDLIGTPLAAIGEIVAGDDMPGVFNGYCGAESGSVPVSATSPALLLKKIEVQKKAKSRTRPPLLPPPVASEG